MNDLISLVKESSLFDILFYEKTRNVLFDSLEDAVTDYINWGFYNLLPTSKLLSTKYTLKNNQLENNIESLTSIFNNKYLIFSYDYELIKDSGLFDLDWYRFEFLNNDKDIDPVLHYLKYSHQYNTAPSFNFSSACYIADYIKLIQNGIDPLIDYILNKKHRKCVKSYLYQQLSRYPLINVNQKIDYKISFLNKLEQLGRVALKNFNKKIVVYNKNDLYDRYIYSKNNCLKLASTGFLDAEDYLDSNEDVRNSGIPPLIHYFLYGKKEKRKGVLSEDCVTLEYSNFENIKVEKKRALIFAMYLKNGIIPDQTIYLLKKLKEHVDCISIVSDSSIKKNEFSKIINLVNYAKFQRHHTYDFGSYSIAFKNLSQLCDISLFDELLVANDSIVGPVDDLSPFFQKAKESENDIYGISKNDFGYKNSSSTNLSSYSPHIQSYFMVLSKSFFMSEVWDSFINSVTREKSKIDVVINYEMKLSKLATTSGFTIGSYYKTDNKYDVNPASNDAYQILDAAFFIKNNVMIQKSADVINFIFKKHNFEFTLQNNQLIHNSQSSANSVHISDNNISILFNVKIDKQENKVYFCIADERTIDNNVKLCVTDVKCGDCHIIPVLNYNESKLCINYVIDEFEKSNMNCKFNIFVIPYNLFKNIEVGKISILNEDLSIRVLKLYSGKIRPTIFDKDYYVHFHSNNLLFFKNYEKFIGNIINCKKYSAASINYIPKLLEPKNFILFAEKPSMKCDNSFQLFKFILESNSFLANYVYYLVDQNGYDNEINPHIKSHLIVVNSKEHINIYIHSKILVTSYNNLVTIPSKISLYQISILRKFQKHVLVSHGYTGGYNNSCMVGSIFSGDYDAVVSCTKYEDDYFKKLGHNNTHLLGYPRMDKWVENNNNQQLEVNSLCIMFTFRRSLLRATAKDFANSNYISHISEIISTIKDKCNSISKINYIFHNSLNTTQRIIIRSILLSINPNIIFIDNEDTENFNQALSKSEIFITDYSSVGFDMTYNNNKKILFYTNPDFLEGHYVLNNSFNEQCALCGALISRNMQEFINLLTCSNKNNINSLFQYLDGNNSERVTNMLKDLYTN